MKIYAITNPNNLNRKCSKSLKCCQFTINCVIFFSLLVSCYFLYMDDAIEKSKRKATTFTKRSESIEFEVPAIIICPEPPFKQSVSEKYNLSVPARFVFRLDKSFNNVNDIFGNKTIQYLHEEFSYAKDLNFVYHGVDLKPGVNEVDFYGERAEIELKIVPTIYSGTCHLMQMKGKPIFHNVFGTVILVGYDKDMNHLDIPKGKILKILPSQLLYMVFYSSYASWDKV